MPLLILQNKFWNFEGIQMRKYVRFPEYNQCSERFNSSLFKAVNFKNLLTELTYKWLKACLMPIINSKSLNRDEIIFWEALTRESAVMQAHCYKKVSFCIHAFIYFYWSIVDLQCCVTVRCAAKWFRCIDSFSLFFYLFIFFFIYFY